MPAYRGILDQHQPRGLPGVLGSLGQRLDIFQPRERSGLSWGDRLSVIGGGLRELGSGSGGTFATAVQSNLAKKSESRALRELREGLQGEIETLDPAAAPARRVDDPRVRLQILNTVGVDGYEKWLETEMTRAPAERRIIDGPDGRKYYEDTREEVLPGIEPARATPPSGYMWKEDGTLTFIPGGVADPAVIEAQAQARNIPSPPAQRQPPAGYMWTPDGGLAFVPGGPADPAIRGSDATGPTPITVFEGDYSVQKIWDPQVGDYVEIGRGRRFAPRMVQDMNGDWVEADASGAPAAPAPPPVPAPVPRPRGPGTPPGGPALLPAAGGIAIGTIERGDDGDYEYIGGAVDEATSWRKVR